MTVQNEIRIRLLNILDDLKIKTPRVPRGKVALQYLKDTNLDLYTKFNNEHNTSQAIYDWLYPEKIKTCNLNNKPQYQSFSVGYRYCGPAKTCECARLAVSNSVRIAKKDVSIEDQHFINEKRSQTNIDRYGVSNVMELPEVYDTVKQHLCELSQNQNVRDKRIQTNIERYGVENVAQSLVVQDKIKQTNIERYGVESVLSLPTVQNKIKQTNIERYGYESATQSLVVQDKIKQTNIERYGVENVAQADHIASKISISLKMRYYKEVLPTYHLITPLFDINSYNGAVQDYEWECVSCLAKLTGCVINGKPPKCYICNSKSISAPETEIHQFLDSMGIEYITHDRNTIAPKELDILIPSHNIAIEFHGVYWHCSKFTKKYAHRDKYISCKENDITLISIFSDDWDNLEQKEKIKLRIKHMLMSAQTKIGARQCEIRHLSTGEYNQFCDRYHTQNTTNASIRIGLYHKDILVHVMGFSKSRFSTKHDYELIRSCGSILVVGAISKIMKYFNRTYEFSTVVSYASCLFGSGKSYTAAGFVYDGYCGPSLSFININGACVRESRQKYQAHKYAIPQGMTTTQYRESIGIYEIWDCGSERYVWYKQ